MLLSKFAGKLGLRMIFPSRVAGKLRLRIMFSLRVVGNLGLRGNLGIMFIPRYPRNLGNPHCTHLDGRTAPLEWTIGESDKRCFCCVR